MQPRFFQTADLPDLQAFLSAAQLPTAGIESSQGGFLLVEDAGQLVAVTGMEIHGHVGLLRSVAVAPQYRSRGIAGQLVQQALEFAERLGLTDVYLLTTTAQNYFPRFGFQSIARADAPAPLQASAEFQGGCPDSATLMHLLLKEKKLSETHTTDTFLTTLRQAPALPLEFQLNGETLVPAGYHVTEVKAVTIKSMDCGGKANAWDETIIQLMDGTQGEARAGFMTTTKFLSIYDRVAAHIPVEGSAEVRFEYGNTTQPAMQYHLSGVDVQPGRVLVSLSQPGVTCKALGVSSSEGQCCGPTPVQVNESTSSCCATPELIQLG